MLTWNMLFDIVFQLNLRGKLRLLNEIKYITVKMVCLLQYFRSYIEKIRKKINKIIFFKFIRIYKFTV